MVDTRPKSQYAKMRHFCRRQGGRTFVWGVVGVVLMILGRGGAFIPALSEAVFCVSTYQKGVPLKLVETDVCSLDCVTILETPFSSIDYRLQDQNDANVEKSYDENMELSPAFLLQHISIQEGDVKGGSSNDIGASATKAFQPNCDVDENTDKNMECEDGN
jgi:hypothetical protein